MTTPSTTNVPSTGNQQILQELTGGLTLLPYGIYPLIAALAFYLGWIDWETNYGPPYVGFLLAWLIDRAIRWGYRKKYHFSWSKNRSETGFSRKDLLVILAGVAIVAAFIVDDNFPSPIRWMPLLFGLWSCWEGIAWYKRNWVKFGLIHFLSGLIPIGVAILPLLLGVSSRNQFFGADGIYELAAVGVVLIVVGIMEHLIFLQVWNNPNGELPGLPSDAVI